MPPEVCDGAMVRELVARMEKGDVDATGLCVVAMSLLEAGDRLPFDLMQHVVGILRTTLRRKHRLANELEMRISVFVFNF